MKILELFAGTRSIGKAFEAHGHKVFSVEWDKSFDHINLYADIGQLTAQDILEQFGKPDVIWASPDCSSYSVAGIGHHRKLNPLTKNLDPQTEYAKFCDEVNQHVVELIKELNPTYWFIENPRGGLRKMTWMQGLPRHTVTYCFSGDTKIITDKGHFALSDVCNKSVKILNRYGDWESAIIRNYGVAKLYKITLTRCRREKIVYATGNHLWWATKCLNGKLQIFTTTELRKGVHIPYSIPKQPKFQLVPEYVCRGFVYGDGWVLAAKPHAFCQFVGEKQEMLKYFEQFGGKRWQDNKDGLDIVKIYSLPRCWKCDMPKITDSPSNIFSWLAGYIAADGSCSNTNGQLTISSSKKEDLLKVKELAEIIGIGTYPINEISRLGYGPEKTMLYQMTFMRKDVPDALLLRAKHLSAFIQHKDVARQSREWKVVSVEDTDIVAPVYCCESEYSESFTLEDNIVTHNCKYETDRPVDQRRMKPTDIWTNHPNPRFIPPCNNGDPCHAPAPRGSRTGTQGLKDSRERSVIPPYYVNI